MLRLPQWQSVFGEGKEGCRVTRGGEKEVLGRKRRRNGNAEGEGGGRIIKVFCI